MKKLKIKIKGVTPLLMHNDRLANPLLKVSKDFKAISRKRNKTDEDILTLADMEWKAGIYYDKALGPYISDSMIHAVLREGAKLNKLGTTVKRALIVTTEKAPLIYKGTRDIEELAKIDKHRDIRTVVIARARTLRARPCFPEWALEFEVAYHQQSLEESDIIVIANNAGFCGLGDYRPRFGRFIVEEITAITK